MSRKVHWFKTDFCNNPRVLLWAGWVVGLELAYPVPWIGGLATFAGVLSILTVSKVAGARAQVTHCKVPAAWREDSRFQRRLVWHHGAQLYILVTGLPRGITVSQVMCAQYWAFSCLFYLSPLTIQWILPLLLTVVRYIRYKLPHSKVLLYVILCYSKQTCARELLWHLDPLSHGFY